MRDKSRQRAKAWMQGSLVSTFLIVGLLMISVNDARALSTCDFCGAGCPAGTFCITDTTPQDPDCGAAGVKYCFYFSECTANSDCLSGDCCAVDASDGSARCTPIELAGGVVENRVCMASEAPTRTDCLEVVDQLTWTNPAREMGLDRAAEAICTNIQKAPSDGCIGLCHALTNLAEKNSTDGASVVEYCAAMTAADGDCMNEPN